MSKKHINAAEGVEEGDFPSELRYDLASKNWVVIASGRSKRPETFKEEKKTVNSSDPEDCPFCKDENYEHVVEVATEKGVIKPNKKLPEDWFVASIPNKFPAFIPDSKLDEKKENGLYKKMNAVGYHEVIISKNHNKSVGEMSVEEVRQIFNLYRSRYRDLKSKKNVNHISIFHNHGKEAGASIDHPHSQLATTPLVDVDLNSALESAKEYKNEKGNCLYCDMQGWELRKKERVVYENDDFLAVCPFASKVAFQTIVTPKKHYSNFEDISDKLLASLADAFQKTMKKIYKGVGNPPYNYYLHTAPCDGEDHDYYHWHWTILPKTSVFAGFELGAGIEISTIKPEIAAKHLKKI